MTRAPLVDVAIATYNHEKYIAQAIESVLAQHTDFSYRLIIGDDCSTDNTQAIIRSYAERHPGRIVTSFEPKNLGIADRDRVGVKVLRRCTAEYVTMLDGDDYWISQHKLQKQVDFLESHPECAICFHNVRRFFEDGSEPPSNLCPADQKEISTIEDLLKGNFIPTCSVMFRRGLFSALPDWFYYLPTGDWPLHILNAEHGKIGYINEVMAAYRVHGKGYWSTQDRLLSLEKEMKIFEAFDAHFRGRYRRMISQIMSERFLILTEGYEQRGELGKARTYARRCLVERLRGGRSPGRYLPLLLLRLHAPALYKNLRGLKKLWGSVSAGP